MREAVGSTFLFKIMIVFIFFFTAFLAIAINYAQAFRTKNQIINAIEQAEGYNDTSRQQIKNIRTASNYFREVDCNDDDGYFLAQSESADGSRELQGICIRRNDSDASTNSAYYSVVTYVHFNFPIIGDIITVPVTGETKLIVNDNFDG